MKTRLTSGIAAAATAALTLTVAAPTQAADTTERRAGSTSLVEVLAADGTRLDRNWKDFDILEQGVLAVLDAKPNSPVKVLARGGKRATAFLPTDAAFRTLVKDLSGTRPASERATLDALLGVADVDTLEAVLLYHVVAGKTLGSPKVLAADGARLKTASGAKVGVRVKGSSVTLVDLDTDSPDARVVTVDVNKGNKQIGHAINRVLRPLDL